MAIRSSRDGSPRQTEVGMAVHSLVLVADSNQARRSALVAALTRTDCRVRDISRLDDVFSETQRCSPNLVLIGYSAVDGHDVIAAIDTLRRAERRLPVVLVVDADVESLAVAALRAGVKDYFCEPIDNDAIAASVRRCLTAANSRRHDAGRPANADTSVPGPFLAAGGSMRRIHDYLLSVAEHDSTVLITGETGTGKELAACLVHEQSARRNGRFVSVNCAAIPDGLIESELFGYESGAFTGAAAPREGLLQLANRGTVFLDEIGDMGPHAQAKILRAIETREVYRLGGKRPTQLDVRVVAATNQDVERAVEEGRFRKDLYFRLNVARVHLPALRERRCDIVSLLDHFLREMNRCRPARVEGFARETLDALQMYDWPGNVRELKNLVEAIFVRPPSGRRINIDDLPDAFQRRLRGVCGLPDAERRRLVEALVTANWNKSQAADLLHWSRMTVYRKMAKYSVIRSAP
jgi:DNA-binding NtrC family response regulator